MKNKLMIIPIAILIWVFWFFGCAAFFDLVINREVNGYIQLLTTIIALILTVGLIVKTTVILIDNFKTNKKNND